ncbi:MAG: hypothetical protein F4039_05495 [Gammaproteobacteria bacterium]|nr:hypothetical protein [Gammaproteobacteria bacterium]MYF52418.1 hypothetical protein [Gammaproteobacteria bacterium]MYK43521.1 hypothetical protein [Gammaproteobacteria bacterium]
MQLDISNFQTCITLLENAHEELSQLTNCDQSLYQVYRTTCIKEFELVLEQCAVLLRKVVSSFYSSDSYAANLPIKDLFRYAAKHDLLDVDSVERWLHYRQIGDDSVYEHGEEYAEQTVKFLPNFIDDAKTIVELIERINDG